MKKRPRDRPNLMFSNSDPDDEPLNEGGQTFAWEFVNDEHFASSPSASPRITSEPMPVSHGGRVNRRQEALDGERKRTQGTHPDRAATARPGTQSAMRVGRLGAAQGQYIREQLDRALDRWWSMNEMPPLALLRDGLLLLEAGGTISESQRTLLLRAALAYDRGVQTALRHQIDAERVALVLAEALVEWDLPLAPERLPAILAGDTQVQTALVAELERSRVLSTGIARERAEAAFAMVSWTFTHGRNVAPFAPASRGLEGRRPFRQALFILLVVALVGFVIWQQRRFITPAGMVAMPAASYYLVFADGTLAQEPVQLESYFIDRFEATNRDYRTCVEQGECEWPVQTSSATRMHCFTDPAFDRYPVVNVTHTMAASFCAWQGKRLPSAAEWQAAASVAPTTGQRFRFPWGESFDAQRTNSNRTGFGDTLVVGAFRPGGDSPSGATDMAGNVAEWTATFVPGLDAADVYAVVKGGSFAHGVDALRVEAEVHVAVGSAAPEVGFRCARTRLSG